MGRLYLSAIAAELERAIHCTRNNPLNAIIFYKYHLLSGQKKYLLHWSLALPPTSGNRKEFLLCGQLGKAAPYH